MKKILLCSFALVFTLSLHADIHHTYYGEDGWRIDMNENLAVDVNGNGLDDFYVNGYEDEIGFVPIFGIGCFSSPSETAYTSFGARELGVYQAGEMTGLNGANMYDYIDDDRGSMYSVSGGFAEGWNDLEDQYIAFAVIRDGLVYNAWMRVAVDVVAQQMVIKEIAYADGVQFDGPGIEVGDTGASGLNDLSKELNELSIAPNPVRSNVRLNFVYQGKEELILSIYNSIGQQMYRENIQAPSNNISMEIAVANWAAGNYYVRFETETAVHMEKLQVMK